jgi:hypothetical protein
MAVKRPRVRRPAIPEDLTELTLRCEFVGSQVHKDRRSWLGLPRLRRSGEPEETATICPLVTEDERKLATGWVRSAVLSGQFDRTDWQNGFPRRIWHQDEAGQYWYGFLSNSGAGSKPIGRYKGWPISQEEKDEIFG